ncbi:MAG: N-acetylmuramoyl-L-alanine amidase [Verrucomicrobiota bacterium]
MNRWTKFLLFGFLAPAAAVAEARFSTVVIDPGHGGIDSGAVWYGTEEKDLTLPVSIMLRDQLLARGINNVVMTRDTDVIMGLQERAEFSNKQEKPIFVSIHFNANLDRSVTGIELYVMPKSTVARELAETIEVPIKALGRRHLGVKTYNLKVLRATDHPAVVIEGGFLSNAAENRTLKTAAYQRKLVKAIADGILAYRDSKSPELMIAQANPLPNQNPPAPPKEESKPAPKLTPIPPNELPPAALTSVNASPKPEPAPASAADEFRVQFGAFSMPQYASNLRDKLNGKGIDVLVLQRRGQTKTFHRVVSQRTFSDVKSADKWANQLVQSQSVDQAAVTR